MRAAIPYVRLFRDWPSASCREKSVHNLPHGWVARAREGRRITWTLTPRGRGIVECIIAAHIHGMGPYTGLVALREMSKEKRRAESLASWSAKGERVLERHPLRAGFDALRSEIPTSVANLVVENAGSSIVFRPLSYDMGSMLSLMKGEGAVWKEDTLICDPAVTPTVLRSVAGSRS